ncbi:hypothetical protein DICVIV_11498 [Dictyocaulus viviparus]|uniref:Uncharacterized protein n=1 Tax=Dictyocaulus viviparus TaxID=29172 RepID=A0A0D8XJJ3_DICVI|nr:hypothetical protein DICVIV_11498 [Dictyocaulus viviparus]
MEKAPDMDVLLDELEEIENPSKPSMTFENLSDHCAVIEIPINLRRLSDKDSIRINLEPPGFSETRVRLDGNTLFICFFRTAIIYPFYAHYIVFEVHSLPVL